MVVVGVMMRKSTFVVLVFAVSTSACRLFGIDATSCTPDDATTCPTGFVCNQAGSCVAGTGTEGEGEGEGEPSGEGEGEGALLETVVDDSNGALLIAIQGNTLFWSERTIGGALMRKGTAAADVPVVMYQSASERVSSLVAGVEDVYFTVERDGPALDDVFILPRGADSETAPDTLTTAPIDLGTLADRGPNAIAVREQVAAGEVTTASLVWIRPHPEPTTDVEIPLLDRLELPSAELIQVLSSGVSGPGYRPAALAQLDNYNVIFETFQNQVFCTYNYVTISVQSAYNCILNDNLAAAPPGQPWASERVGSALYLSVKRSDGSGSIYRVQEVGEGGLFEREIEMQTWLNVVNDDNALTYAADLATDGVNLFYTTAGPQGPYALMRANTETLVVDRLVDLEAEGAGVAIDSDYIYYAIPQLNRIDRIARR
jgi:hypothetical protein